MVAHPERLRLFTRQFVALGLADLAYFTAVGVAIFALPLYVTGPGGGDEAGAGVAFGAFAISALVLRPFAGRLADLHGRRPLLLGGALIAAASLALCATTDALPLLVALRLMAGVAEAAFFVATFAALADIAPPGRMGEALSYNSLGLYAGIALGPPLGEALLESIGFVATWLGAAGLAVLAALIAAAVGETRGPRPSGAHRARLIHRPAIPISLGFMTSLVAVGGFMAFASLQATRVGFADASVMLLAYGALVVVFRIAFARVPDRVPSLALAAASLVAIAVGLVIAAAWARPAGQLVAIVALALGITFSTPAFFTAVFATAAPGDRGAASGTASAALDLGLGLGPILLGLVAAAHGIPWAFAVGAAVALGGAAWTLGLARPGATTTTGRPAPEPPARTGPSGPPAPR